MVMFAVRHCTITSDIYWDKLLGHFEEPDEHTNVRQHYYWYPLLPHLEVAHDYYLIPHDALQFALHLLGSYLMPSYKTTHNADKHPVAHYVDRASLILQLPDLQPWSPSILGKYPMDLHQSRPILLQLHQHQAPMASPCSGGSMRSAAAAS